MTKVNKLTTCRDFSIVFGQECCAFPETVPSGQHNSDRPSINWLLAVLERGGGVSILVIRNKFDPDQEFEI